MTTYWTCSFGLPTAKEFMKSLRASQSTVYRSTELEAATTVWRNTSTVCTIVAVGYGVRMKRVLACSEKCGLLLFFLWSWQGRRQSKIGCYSAQRWAAFHCNTWEKIQHWRQNTDQCEFGSFWSWNGPDCQRSIFQERKYICLIRHDQSSNEALQVKKAVCWRTLLYLFWKKVQHKGLEAPCREKPPGEVRARTCGTKSPSRSEALRFIDSSKSPTTKTDGSLVNFRRRLSNRHGRPRRMLIWTFEGNTDQTLFILFSILGQSGHK